MREVIERVRAYEMMTVFSPELAEDAIPDAVARIAGYVESAGGKVTVINREQPWGRRRLAYPIRHDGHDVRDGYYVLFYFDAVSVKIVEIERELKLNDDVIRHILTLQVAPPAPPAEEAVEPPAPVARVPDEPAPAAGAPAEAPEAEPAADEPAAELAPESPSAAQTEDDETDALPAEEPAGEPDAAPEESEAE